MGAAHTSRRDLLGGLAATPAAGIKVPFPDIPISGWHAAIQAWRKAEAKLAPIRNRFDMAETRWFAASTDPHTIAEHDQANRDFERQLMRCDAALEALLNTRPPTISAVLWKLENVASRLWPDIWNDLQFLADDLRAFETGDIVSMDGGAS